VLLALGAALGVPASQLGAFQEQRPPFRGTVARVSVDVIVKDQDGRFVGDLQPADFRLFEDGVPQQILSVDVVDSALDAGREGSSGLVGLAPAVPPGEPTGAAAGTSGGRAITGSADLGAVVYLIDTRRLEPKGTARFVRALREQLSGVDRLPTLRAAYLIDKHNVFREIAHLTTDPEVLLEAVEELDREPKYGLPLDRPVSPGGASFDRVVSERAILTLIEQFCSSLGALRGRKALVWVSGGFFSGGTPFENDPVVMERLEELARTANSANLSIYTIDPRRRIDMKNNFYRGAFDVSRRSALGSGGRSIANQLFAASLSELSDESLRNGLVYAARKTGGLSFLSWSDADRMLEDIEEDNGSYYLLTYEPPSRVGDGAYHSIHVEVLDPSLEVRYRMGYVDYREGEERERRLEGALAAPGITSGFPLKIEPIGGAEADGRSLALIQIAGELPAPGRAASDAPDDIAFAMSGMAVPRGRSRIIRMRRWLQWRDIEILTDEVSEGTRFVVKQGWPLGPGEYEVRVALYRRSTQEVAAARARLCVEAIEGPPEGGPGYSVRPCVE
jgi:VWFA-related protein